MEKFSTIKTWPQLPAEYTTGVRFTHPTMDYWIELSEKSSITDETMLGTGVVIDDGVIVDSVYVGSRIIVGQHGERNWTVNAKLLPLPTELKNNGI